MKFAEFKTGPARSVMQGLGETWKGCLAIHSSPAILRKLAMPRIEAGDA